jgi:hypothetical protein
MMVCAEEFRPDKHDAAGDCGLVFTGPCLLIKGLPGTNNDKISILVLTGEPGWIDADANPVVAARACFSSDVDDVFILENPNLDNTLDMRKVEATGVPGYVQRNKIPVIN